MRNTDWLDDLARSLSQGLPRRGALRAAAASLMAGFLATFSPSTAPTKRNKRKHKNKRKQKQKRRKKNKDRGKSQQTGSCTFDQTADGSFLLVEVAEDFEGKPLTLVQRTTVPSVGEFTQQLVVNLGQQLVLQFDADNPDETTSRLRAHFGVGFHGIEELGIIIINSKTVGGSINGRELVARAIEDVEQDPDGWEFADGGPPPVTTTDPDLLSAVQAVLDRAADEVANCAGDQLGVAAAAVAMLRMMPGLAPTADWLGGGTASAQNAKRTRNTRTRAGRASAKTNPTVCDGADEGCLACWAGCATALGGCCVGTFGLGCGFCYVAYEECLDLCDAGVCCPVECGNDLPSSCCCEGETCCEDNCCEKDETCWPGGVCCRDGLDFCLGTCCPQNTFCTEGICCRENEEPCFGECCPSGETCREPGLCCPREVIDCDGICCPSERDSCQGSVCCPAGQIVCGTTCCEVDDICKPPADGGELKVCCPKDQVCGQVCCDELSRCIDGEHSTCCSIFHEECHGGCCDLGEVCVEGRCCPGGQVCGATCCPASNFCADPGTTDCRPCDEGQMPCPFDIEGAPDCCPQDTLCCGNGTCCQAGVPCCDKGNGLKCDPNCLS
jgi:hypothetical protein